MLTSGQLIIIPFLLITAVKSQQLTGSGSDTSHNINSRMIPAINNQEQKNMGISINLYRVGKAEKLNDLENLEEQISKAADTKVDLYKITGDLAIIFLNTTNPYSNTNTIPYKMLYGRKVHQSINIGEIGGFLPSSEIPGITQWIKSNKIETFDGFSKMYDNLSIEVKKELGEMGTNDKTSLFNGYVKPLVTLYFTALENNNSIVFIGQ